MARSTNMKEKIRYHLAFGHHGDFVHGGGVGGNGGSHIKLGELLTQFPPLPLSKMGFVYITNH